MTNTVLKITVAALIIFAISQQVLVRQYEAINDKLQDALGKCIGLKKVGE